MTPTERLTGLTEREPSGVAGDGPLDDPRITLLGMFLEAHAGLTRELERRLDRDAGLSLQWFEVLLRLVRTPGHRLRMSDLAAQTTLTASGLTRAVDRLEGAGLVRREACPSDRRGAFAVLTDDGRTRVVDAMPQHLAHIDELLGRFSADELTFVEQILRRLRSATNPDAERASDCPPEADDAATG